MKTITHTATGCAKRTAPFGSVAIAGVECSATCMPKQQRSEKTVETEAKAVITQYRSALPKTSCRLLRRVYTDGLQNKKRKVLQSELLKMEEVINRFLFVVSLSLLVIDVVLPSPLFTSSVCGMLQGVSERLSVMLANLSTSETRVTMPASPDLMTLKT